jgi:predicted phage terminase large subunit-like protein
MDLNEPNEQELALLLRGDLGNFTERVFNHLNPGTAYLPNWHMELIASKLQAVLEGKIKRLIINVPPRSLKSIMTSVAFVAWALGHNPALQFLCASYGQDLADKHAQDCRNVMSAQWYKRLFGTILQGSRQAAADLRTTKGGGRFATSVGGVLTGLGGDMVLIDDPLKPDEALSESARNAANNWVDNTVMSRLNDKRTGAIVIIMQRLHMDDLVGHVMNQGEWEVLSLPAIAEVKERFEFETLTGPTVVVRQIGEALHPQREPIEILLEIKKTIGEYNFAGQYQQSPSPAGGGLVKAAWLRYYEAHEKPAKFDQVLQSWDTASKESELADFSVCTTWGLKRNGAGYDFYLLDVWREKVAFPGLKKAVLALDAKFKPDVILIEDKSSGIQLIQELRAMGLSKVKEAKTEGNKLMRLVAQTPAIEGGFVLLPKHAGWLDAYVLELTTFPAGRHDDQVDSTSQALAWIAVNGVEPGLIAYTRELAEKNGWVRR